jgi:hypothetical protein
MVMLRNACVRAVARMNSLYAYIYIEKSLGEEDMKHNACGRFDFSFFKVWIGTRKLCLSDKAKC